MSVRNRLDMLKQALWVALIPGALLFAWLQFRGYAAVGMIGCDSHAYWLAAREPQTWYTRPPATWDAYLYSPAFAQLLWPLARLPWPAFQVLWLLSQLGATVWLLRPLGWTKTLTVVPFLTGELLLGNLYIFFGGVLVMSVSGRAGALALPILTKVTPGAVGLWLALRGDWRAVRQSLLLTALVVGVSVALDPHAWIRWLAFLVESSGSERGHSTLIRLVMAAGLALWAAKANRSILLVPCLILACPVLGGWNYLAVATALPRLIQRDQLARSSLPEQDESVVATENRPTSLLGYGCHGGSPS